MTAATIEPAGDQGFYVRFGDTISPEVHARVLGALHALDRAALPGLVDIVPSYATLLVLYDPAASDAKTVRTAIAAALTRATPLAPQGKVVELPVLYHPAVAVDLEPLAAEKGITVAELIALHTAPTYRCYMLGFRPGFPFLGGLSPRLTAARLATPRTRVAAGSVGIGGEQTGIYPVDSPGGWRIIGRTPARLFDPARAEPFLVQPGDQVRFRAVDAATFAAWDAS